MNLTHSHTLTHSFTHSLTHSLLSLTRSLTHSRAHTLSLTASHVSYLAAQSLTAASASALPSIPVSSVRLYSVLQYGK